MAEDRPQNIVQASGEVAGDIVGGLKGSPMLLAIVVLNVIGVAVAGWIGLQFLEAVERGDQAERALLEELLDTNRGNVAAVLAACFPDRNFKLPDTRGRQDRDDRAPH